MKPILFGIVLALAYSTSATAQQYEPDQLASMAEEYVASRLTDDSSADRVQVQAGALDPRMGARYCSQAIQVGLANNASLDRQTTVMLNCPDRDSWRMFIPVRIQQMRPVVVTARALAPGQVIGSSDITISYVDVQQLRDSAHTDPDELIGAQVKRRIGANQAIQARHTCFVCRGQDVTIVSGSGTLQIRATGVARSDGLMGDRITVRNTRSNKDVQAVVSGNGEVRVGQ